jgi:predicted secreted hydrolase
MELFCETVDKLYSDTVTKTDLINSLTVPGHPAQTIDAYCQQGLATAGSKFMFTNSSNDPLHCAHLYKAYIRETPELFLVDGKPDLVQKITDYIDYLVVTGEGLTAQKARTLQGMLPANFTQGYDRIDEQRGVRFPRDHHVHTNTAGGGWYFIVGNMINEAQNKKVGIQIIFYYAPLFPREFLRSRGLADDAYMLQSMAFSITVESGATKAYYHNNTGLVSVNTGLAQHSVESDKKVFFSVGNSFLLSKDNDLAMLDVIATDVDAQGKVMVCSLQLAATKPLFLQGNHRGCTPCVSGAGSLYYSYPRYSVQAVSVAYDGASIMEYAQGTPCTDKNLCPKLDRSFFWLDHQWVYALSGAYLDNLSLRALENLSSASPMAGWFWFMAHLNDGRDWTFAASQDKTLDKLPVGEMKVTSNVEGKIVEANGLVSKLFDQGSLVARKWVAVTINTGLAKKKTVTAYLATEFVVRLTTGQEFLVMVDSGTADAAAPVQMSRNGGFVREGTSRIYENVANPQTVLGFGYVEMAFFFVSQQDQDDVTYEILGGALQANQGKISDRVRAKPDWFLKLQSVIFLIFLAALVFLILIVLPIYILYTLYQINKQK